MKLRVRQLNELERILIYIEGEIRVKHSVLADAFLSASKRAGQPFNEWLLFLSERMKNEDTDSYSFLSIWKTSLDILRWKTKLNKSDMSLLDSVGQTLGYLDIKAMEQGLFFERENLKLVVNSLYKELPNKMKLAIVSGGLGGIFIIVVLI